ncbi:MAG: TetR/AcrR family transcriptional regulator [Clostridia bacterium]|nr:TetR/AcrR family transcriptional regulator [Clostridia bacterium]
MPPKPRITRDMILEAAYAIALEEGAENINARTISQRLGCSTQPVLYHFAHIEDIRREVYRMADEYHSRCLMNLDNAQNPMLSIGLNYIRFAAKEKHLFRLLFQSDGFAGQSIASLVDAPELMPVLTILQQEAGLTLAQTKLVFKALCLLVHGYASMLANNTMGFDETEAVPMLEMAFMGMIGAVKMEEVHE